MSGQLEQQLESVFKAGTPTTLAMSYSSDNILLKDARPDLNVNLAGTTNYDSIILSEPLENYAHGQYLSGSERFLGQARDVAPMRPLLPLFSRAVASSIPSLWTTYFPRRRAR